MNTKKLKDFHLIVIVIVCLILVATFVGYVRQNPIAPLIEQPTQTQLLPQCPAGSHFYGIDQSHCYVDYGTSERQVPSIYVTPAP